MVPQHGPFSLHTMLEVPWLPKTAFPTPMVRPLDESQGSSPLQGHGSCLVCVVALSIEIISVGNTNFLVMVELIRVQHPMSSPKSPWRLSTNTLKISHRTKVTQIKIITHVDFLGKQLLWPTLVVYYKFSVGWKQLWPEVMGFVSVVIGELLEFVKKLVVVQDFMKSTPKSTSSTFISLEELKRKWQA